MEQKFKRGDYVKVAKNLGSSMSHFKSDCEAIVCYSYKDEFGGYDTQSYCIHIKGYGEVSWYYEHQLELIEANRADLLEAWKAEQEAERVQKSNLDWIFKNGNDVSEHPHGASVQALASCLGINNLWGSRGEGLVYYANMLTTLSLAEPFLKSGDKQAWLNFCKDVKMKGNTNES